MIRRITCLAIAGCALACSGCFVVPEPVRFDVRIHGTATSATGTPMRERFSLVNARRKGMHEKCGDPFVPSENHCVVAVITPDLEGRFDFTVQRTDGCLLWLLPPLGILPCDQRDYVALVLESAPASPQVLAFDWKNDKTVIEPSRRKDSPPPFEVRVTDEPAQPVKFGKGSFVTNIHLIQR